MKFWELGESIQTYQHLNKDYLKDGTPRSAADKKVMEATIRRYLRKVSQAIGNTSKGLFPWLL